MGKPKFSADLIRASLNVANPTPAIQANDQVAPAASVPMGNLSAGETMIRLHIDSVVTYRRNPRNKLNERYLDIKESIRDSGRVDNIVKVTKRPGEDHYFPAAGGNTRVLALKELYAEGDKRFEYVDFIFTEYKGEADVLTRHFIENDLRSDLVFWDKAKSLQELKIEIESETGQQISSHRLFSEILAKRGIQIGREIIRTYAFALEKLIDLGSATDRLTRGNVREVIIPNYQKIARLVEKFGTSEDAFHESVARKVFQEISEQFASAREFSLDDMLRHLNDASAEYVGVEPSDFRRMLSIQEQRPDATLAELTAPPAAPTAGVTQATPTTDTSNPSAAASAPADDAAGLTSGEANDDASVGHGDAGAVAPDQNSVGARTGKSTEVLFADNLTPGDQTRQRQENPTGSLDLQGGGGTAESKSEIDSPGHSATASSTPGMPGAALPATLYDIRAVTDVRGQFISSLRAFAQVANLEDAVRFNDRMPLWFYVDLPVPAEHGIPLDIESQAGGNPYRYMAWWYLANLCDVLNEKSATRGNLPVDSPIAIALADDEKWDDEVRNTVGEPLYHDTLGQLINWMADPANPAGESLLNIMVSLRAVRANSGERSSPSTAQEAA